MLDKPPKEVKDSDLSLLWHATSPEPFAVNLSLYQFGRDHLALLGGGEAHIGAVQYLGQTFVAGPHKEGPLVQQVYQVMRPRLQGELLVVGGIHFEALTQGQIQQILNQVDQLLAQFRRDFRSPQNG